MEKEIVVFEVTKLEMAKLRRIRKMTGLSIEDQLLRAQMAWIMAELAKARAGKKLIK